MLTGILVFSHSLSMLFPLCLHFIDDIIREAADFIPHIPVSIMHPGCCLRPEGCLSILLGGSVPFPCFRLTVSHPGSQESLVKTPRLCVSVQRFL